MQLFYVYVSFICTLSENDKIKLFNQLINPLNPGIFGCSLKSVIFQLISKSKYFEYFLQNWSMPQDLTVDRDLRRKVTSLLQWVNTLRPRQNGRRFADDTFKRLVYCRIYASLGLNELTLHTFINANYGSSSQLVIYCYPGVDKGVN